LPELLSKVDYQNQLNVQPNLTHGDYSCISNRTAGEYLFHSQNGGAITVKIFDVTGMEVWHYSSLYNSTDIQEISLPSLSSGMYIMQASNGVWHDECVMMK